MKLLAIEPFSNAYHQLLIVRLEYFIPTGQKSLTFGEGTEGGTHAMGASTEEEEVRKIPDPCFPEQASM